MFKRKPNITEQSGFEESPKAQQFTRRKFLTRIGLTAFFLTIGGVFTSVVAFILPKLNFEPKTSFSIGPPSDYQVGDMKLLDTYQVYIFRSKQGFQAVSAICTHLGCSYKPFGPPSPEYPVVHAQCPCHGSVFSRDGRRIGGPAPRPLPFYDVGLSADGRLIVDKGKANATDELSRLAGEGVGHDLYFDPAQGQMVKGDLPDGEDCKPCHG
jgi:nitrite reductase/ring-hydroxylating ferredoxin subunit